MTVNGFCTHGLPLFTCPTCGRAKPFEYPTTVVMYGVAPSDAPWPSPFVVEPTVPFPWAVEPINPVRDFSPLMMLPTRLTPGEFAAGWYAVTALTATLALPLPHVWSVRLGNGRWVSEAGAAQYRRHRRIFTSRDRAVDVLRNWRQEGYSAACLMREPRRSR